MAAACMTRLLILQRLTSLHLSMGFLTSRRLPDFEPRLPSQHTITFTPLRYSAHRSSHQVVICTQWTALSVDSLRRIRYKLRPQPRRVQRWHMSWHMLYMSWHMCYMYIVKDFTDKLHDLIILRFNVHLWLNMTLICNKFDFRQRRMMRTLSSALLNLYMFPQCSYVCNNNKMFQPYVGTQRKKHTIALAVPRTHSNRHWTAILLKGGGYNVRFLLITIDCYLLTTAGDNP